MDLQGDRVIVVVISEHLEGFVTRESRVSREEGCRGNWDEW